MATNKKGKSKSMGKKDLKRTKGGLLPAVSPTYVKIDYAHKVDSSLKISPNTLGTAWK